jgi:hypothetical protein
MWGYGDDELLAWRAGLHSDDANSCSLEGKTMATFEGVTCGYVEWETVTGDLRTRMVRLDEPIKFQDADGERLEVADGSLLLVVDRVDLELALVEELVDLADLGMHARWSRNHGGEETRTPFDLRAPAFGGRETPAIPF